MSKYSAAELAKALEVLGTTFVTDPELGELGDAHIPALLGTLLSQIEMGLFVQAHDDEGGRQVYAGWRDGVLEGLHLQLLGLRVFLAHRGVSAWRDNPFAAVAEHGLVACDHLLTMADLHQKLLAAGPNPPAELIGQMTELHERALGAWTVFGDEMAGLGTLGEPRPEQ